MMPSWMPAEHGALIVEAAHQHADAAIQRPHDVLFRHFAVVEHQLGGVEPRMPILSIFWPMEKPFMPFSIRKAVMPGSRVRPVLA
jgi:hypothetical protein